MSKRKVDTAASDKNNKTNFKLQKKSSKNNEESSSSSSTATKITTSKSINKDFKSSKQNFSAKKDFKSSKSNTPVKKDYKTSKPNYDLVESLKSDWNKARVRNVTGSEKDKLMMKMADRVKGKIVHITLRHDVSRIVQSLLQFGSSELRSEVLKEISTKILDISKTPYGHFMILKIIAYCTTLKDQTIITNALAGHFVSIGTNVIGARIVESILQLYPSKLTKLLKAEFYGKNFKIFMGEPPKNLRSIIEALPSKVGNVLDHMRDLIQKLIEKSLLEFTYVHNLLYEYILELHEHQKLAKIEELVTSLSDSLPKLISTKNGSKAVCIFISYASAKDRKSMMKSLKSKVVESLLHPSAHLAIIRLVQCTDDVVNVQKMMLNEIKSTEAEMKYSASGDLLSDGRAVIAKLAMSQYGSKLILFMLSNNFKFLEPDEQPLFIMPSPSSKKTDAARKREHLIYMKSTMMTVLNQNLSILIRDRFGSRIIPEIIRVFYPANIVSNLARVFAGLNIEDGYDMVDDSNENYDYENNDEGDDDEEDDVGNNDSGVSGDDTDTNNDTETKDNHADDGEEDFDEEEFKEYDEIADDFLTTDDVVENADRNSTSNNKTKTKKDNNNQSNGNQPEDVEKVLLPIQEDPVAHIMLKRLISLEQSFEAAIALISKDNDSATADAIDKSLWENQQPESFTSQLLSMLQCENKLAEWISQNRPCLVLAWIVKVPSIKKLAHEVLVKNKIIQKLISENDTKETPNQGAKVLLEELNNLK